VLCASCKIATNRASNDKNFMPISRASCSHYFRPLSGAKYCDKCMSVCLSVRSHISKTTCQNFTQSSVPVNCGPGSVFFRRRYNQPFTYCFVNDIMLTVVISLNEYFSETKAPQRLQSYHWFIRLVACGARRAQ